MRIAFCILILGSVGCGARSSGNGAAPGQLNSVDGFVDSSVDSSVDDTAPDGEMDADAADQTDAGNVCIPFTDWTGCGDSYGNQCQTTWAGVLMYPLCSDSSDAGAPTGDLRMDCGAYHVREIDHGTRNEKYIYDIATGQLVEIQYDSPIFFNSSISCVGPAEGIALDCSDVTPTPICDSDGGIVGNPSGCVAPIEASQCLGNGIPACPPTWDGVLAKTTCPNLAAADQRWDCGPYHVRSVTYSYTAEFLPVRFTETWYYDVTTGDLIAIYGGTAVPDKVCANGPPTPIEADCLPGANANAASAGTDVCMVDGGARD